MKPVAAGPESRKRPVLVNQRTAPEVLGWTPRRFLDFLKRKNVPHVVDRRLYVARLSDVEAALGLADFEAAPAAPVWSREDFLRKIVGAR
jgi:hypothetical protein